MQTSNRFFNDLAKVANGALSAAAGARQEFDQLIQQRFERFLNDNGWVTREEFDAVRDMVVKSREEQQVLLARIEVLELQIAKATKSVRKRKPSSKTPDATAE